MSFVWLNGMTRGSKQIGHLTAHRNTATTSGGVHGRTYALQASQSHYGRVGAHAEQQHVEGQRPQRLTRLCLLLLPLLLQFDPQEVLLFWFLFEFVFDGPWRPNAGSAGSARHQQSTGLSCSAHFCCNKEELSTTDFPLHRWLCFHYSCLQNKSHISKMFLVIFERFFKVQVLPLTVSLLQYLGFE